MPNRWSVRRPRAIRNTQGWDGAQWLETKLTASDGLIGDEFGYSVAMSADANSVVVGAYRADSNKGSAYVFGWDGTQWGEIKKLIASDGAVGDDFGISVATSASGNSVIIGAAFDDSRKGSAYVYGWDGIQWVEQKLTADDGVDGDYFGQSVTMNGDGSSALVGAFLANSARGSAYVYRSANVPPLVILPAPATLNCAPAEGLPVSIDAAQFVSTSQTITVQDTTAPVISDVPANITAPATGPSGAVVLFPTPTATDICDGVVPVTCALPSGSTFPIGTTLVRGRRLTIEQATQLLDEAARIRAVLGCRADREMSRREDSRGRLSRDED